MKGREKVKIRPINKARIMTWYLLKGYREERIIYKKTWINGKKGQRP
ncbi:MAG: hypothetical protein GY821_10665 [Gammaproteobacteria bacterium]|nr:hypothetical protein [Gammaproteobacteria bacterium]